MLDQSTRPTRCLGAMPTTLAAAIAVGAAAPSLADTPEIIVTGTRTPIEQGKLAASSTVIDRQEIERRQATNLPDLLKGVAGIDLVESGGPGKLTTLFVRGAESDQVLVLVNGIRVGSTSAGLTAFELLPVEHIERIEIIRGPRASQWGSEAIGGVIQIFTVRGAGAAQWSVSAGGGSYDSYRVAASASGEVNNSHYALSAEHLDSKGFDARQPIPGPFGFDQPDDDGFDNASIHVRAGHRFANGAEVGAFALRASGTTEFDGAFQDQTDFVQQVVGGSATLDLHEAFNLQLRVGQSRDETQNFAPDGSFASRFDTERDEASLQSDITLAQGYRLSVGADYRDDKLDSDTPFTETSRDNVGVFVQYLGEVGRYQVHGSVRRDDNQAFGGETTGGVGLSIDVTETLRVYSSYGTAFKTPTFNELFFPDFGNPELDPETSESYEAGVEGAHDWGNWSLRGYRNDIDDLIVTVFDPVSGLFFPDNVDRARIDGIELELATTLAGWRVATALTLLDPEDRNTGAQLARRAEESLTLDVSRNFHKLYLGARVLYQGKRFDDTANVIEVDDYTTVDVTAVYRLTRSLSVRAKIGNLFDEQYETISSFNSAERNVFVSLYYQGQ